MYLRLNKQIEVNNNIYKLKYLNHKRYLIDCNKVKLYIVSIDNAMYMPIDIPRRCLTHSFNYNILIS